MTVAGWLPWIVAVWLFGVGLYGMVTSRNFIHLIGCLSVVQSATYVLLLGIGFRTGAIAPIFYDHPPGTPAVDPVTHALVLTDVVVGAAVTALLLALVLQLHKRRGTLDPEDLRPNERVMLSSTLPPLPVAGPLLVAALLLIFGHRLPRRIPDAIAILTAMVASVICAVLFGDAADAPITYWFGGWTPRDGQAIGIAFLVDQAGAGVATFIALLFTAALVFAWGYFDRVHAHFHVLMLLFMAAMIGFCLTHDIFNMFVWFEVMSVAGFALTGYALRASPLEGALNFTIMNSLGAYLMLGGIGLLYGFGGALDMTALGRFIAGRPPDPVVSAAFAMMATGLLIKAAQAPFHFWLPDAHAVAPSPVSVIFSGAMVSIGIFGLARLCFTVFAGDAVVMRVTHSLLLGLGVASAIIGASMAIKQRHLKRLLAFSTVSHVGLMLIALALLSRSGTQGLLIYLIGHGSVKAVLFMMAGVVLSRLGGIDEIELRGRGRDIWPAGLVMAAAGLLLAGLPVGIMDSGVVAIATAAHAAGKDWLAAPVLFCSCVTGAAVLRAAGRIFLGWGPVAGEEANSATEEETEDSGRPLWLMLLPAALCLLPAVFGANLVSGIAWRAAVAFMQIGELMANAAPAAPDLTKMLAWCSTGLAALIAAFQLLHRSLPPIVTGPVKRISRSAGGGLEYLHSGAIGDYVTWLVVGVALFALSLAAN